MKKLIPLLIVLLILAGCSNGGVSKISDGDTVLFKINDRDITKGNVYSMLRFQDLSNNIVNDAQALLVDSSIELTDEMVEEAKANLASTKESFGDYFSMYYGNGTDEELLESNFIPAVKQSAFIDNYYDENAAKILEADKPVKVHVLYFDSSENGEKALTDLNAGKDIAEIITAYGSTTNASKNSPEPKVVKTSSLEQLVQDYIASEEGQLKEWSKAVLTDNTSFYLVKLVDNDATALKEEYKATYKTDTTSLQALMKEVFNKAKFEVYDQAIYDAIKNNDNLADFQLDN